VLVASVGNVAGSVINWALGRGIEHFRERRWFPIKPAALARAERWYARYGRWSLLLSWAPVIGDPLTMIAGAAARAAWVLHGDRHHRESRAVSGHRVARDALTASAPACRRARTAHRPVSHR
jgi:protein-S-isoprenylcysteine O-methyltransferase Ste14